jgi:hypothetical protein
MVMPNPPFRLEAESFCIAKAGQSVGGDSVVSKLVKSEGRIVTAISDGLGSGIKAGVLAGMTTSMALEFASLNADIGRVAKFIREALPVDGDKGISYSTFTIIDCNCLGEVKVVEYDNPRVMLWRRGVVEQPEGSVVMMDENGMKVFCNQFQLEIEDRLIAVTDGVTQAGMGSAIYPEGWGVEGLKAFIVNILQHNPSLSAAQLSRMVANRAANIDLGKPCDDISCHVLYCRKPRRMMVVTGPPFHASFDIAMARMLKTFQGRKVVCGGTTAKIIAREWQTGIDVVDKASETLLPGLSIDGVDLISEGIITLGRCAALLEGGVEDGKDGAATLAGMMIESDEIHFVVGTRINEAHQDPSLPVELDIRRNVIKRIITILEEKYLKTIFVQYV